MKDTNFRNKDKEIGNATYKYYKTINSLYKKHKRVIKIWSVCWHVEIKKQDLFNNNKKTYTSEIHCIV